MRVVSQCANAATGATMIILIILVLYIIIARRRSKENYGPPPGMWRGVSPLDLGPRGWADGPRQNNTASAIRQRADEYSGRVFRLGIARSA